MARTILFDIDGTLLDSVDLHARSWQQTFHDFGYEVPVENIRRQIGKGADKLMPIFVPTDDLLSHGPDIEAHRTTLLKKHYMSQIKAFPKVRELFQRLRADGVRIGLASSAKTEEIETYKKIADIVGLTDDETSSDDAEHSKPDPDIIHAALNRLGNPNSSEVTYVGDTPYDAQAAIKAHISAIGMLCGGFPCDELTKAGCFAIYSDPADMLSRYDPDYWMA